MTFFNHKSLIIFALLLLPFAGQAQKKSPKSKKGPSIFKKAYHDLTTHYNYYFNSKLALDQSKRQLSEQHKDNYNEILSVKKQGDEDERSGVAPAMDDVIKRSSIAIQIHKISKWVDDCYFLIGQANYYKGDYLASIQTFQYIESEFKDKYRKTDFADSAEAKAAKEANEKEKAEAQKANPGAPSKAASQNKQKAKSAKQRQKDRAKEAKKRNKEKQKARKRRQKGKSSNDRVKEVQKELDAVEEEKEAKSKDKADEVAELVTDEAPENLSNQPFSQGEKEKKRFLNFLRHKRINHLAKIWIAENYLALGNYAAANEVFELLESDINFPKKYRDDFYAMKAQAAIDNEDYNGAKDALTNALDYSKSGKDKARYYFILAQLNQQQSNYGIANEMFNKVLKSRPNYDMEFHTKLKMAETLMLNDVTAKESAMRSLRKMLKDGKNTDYLDKIYYTLAEIELADKNTDAAIADLKKSAETSTVDKNQKGLSYLKLGEIYFDQQDFSNSSAYYDSAVVFLDKKMADYDQIVSRKDILKDLAVHLNTIAFEDSLQRLAKLPAAVRNEIIDEVIDKFEQAAADSRGNEGEADFSNFAQNNINPNLNNTSSSTTGSFYFYNDASIARGYSKFKEKWGDRQLGDFWRISSKAGLGAIAFGDGSEQDSELLDLALKGTLSRDVFIDQLPMTKEKKAVSDEKIVEAMYQAGILYKQSLNNNKKSIAQLEKLQSRFPKNKYDLEASYQLYLLYRETKKAGKATAVKNYIVKNYPKSIYAKLVENPDYQEIADAEKDKLNDFYEKSFSLYETEQYSQVLQRYTQIEELFETNPIKDKFDFLNAQAIGHTQEKEAYVSALKEIVVNHPGTDVEEKSKEILALIDKGGSNSNAKKSKADYNASKSPYKSKMDDKHYFIVHFNGFNSQINQVMDELVDVNEKNFNLEKYKVNQMLLDPSNQLVVIKTFRSGKKAMDYYKKLQEEESKVFKEVKELEFTYFPISKANFTTYFKSKNLDDYLAFFEETYLK